MPAFVCAAGSRYRLQDEAGMSMLLPAEDGAGEGRGAYRAACCAGEAGSPWLRRWWPAAW